ncbi:stromal cell-derived factor 2 isoform X2 [Exaiptasia diaphana]|uniref:MIR domain-containing protein n=1 Tax=Exaiptasia diaphana TaxID=2652724 RepID=A0A913Y0H6_EXADI|nr:stromal cell-derived factor 2 isoform X1 [Exaiptasia diaphana]XP_020912797.1 stromal cell-derived factor 2 isoform X2 [Exaiptasia diaphana]KXJ23447.1 Stromal cell-derived factor 2 [Exaiptasia diaphana]
MAPAVELTLSCFSNPFRVVKAYLLIILATLLTECAYGNMDDFKYVTCGSVVKLLNVQHNVRLHSHEVKYGSGSGQQSVTGVDVPDDGNSYWVIKGRVEAPCKRGSPIKCGATVRIQHLATKRNLHSHHFQSPISHNQEVSAFGEDGAGDSLDEWSVVCSTKHWQRKDTVRFKHKETKVYLHVTGDQFGRPIHGQREVSGYSYPELGNEWKTMEGIYIKPDSEV